MHAILVFFFSQPICGILVCRSHAHLQPQTKFQHRSCRIPDSQTPTTGTDGATFICCPLGSDSWRNNVTFGFVIVYSLPHCIRWALNLVYTRCTKEGCKYGDVEQSVHRKTSLKPLVVKGCFKPSGIILIYLPNLLLFFWGSGFGFRSHSFTISMTQCVRGMWWLSAPEVCLKLWGMSVVQSNCQQSFTSRRSRTSDLQHFQYTWLRKTLRCCPVLYRAWNLPNNTFHFVPFRKPLCHLPVHYSVCAISNLYLRFASANSSLQFIWKHMCF